MHTQTINIAFTISDNYSYHLATTVSSILSNSDSSDTFHFYVLNSGDISDENKRKIQSLKNIKDFDIDWIVVDNNQFINYSTGCHISTNYRLKAASLLKNLDKVIFMDVDTIVLRSLSELWSEDISEYYFGAVIDACTNAFLDYVDDIRDLFPQIPYNTGVMVINLKKWRQDNIEEKLFDTISWYSKKYQRTPDQNALNIVCKDKIKSLDIRYGACPTLAFVQEKPWDYDDKEGLKYSFEKPYILHYASRRELKPWLIPSLPYADFYWKYCKLTPYYEETLCNMVINNIPKSEPQQIEHIKSKPVENIFSIKNHYKNNKKYKIITIFGIKIKFKTRNTAKTLTLPTSPNQGGGQDCLSNRIQEKKALQTKL